MALEKMKLADGHLAYLQEGDGPLILLVHGFPLDHTMWLPLMRELHGTAQFLAVDLRGFGKSSITPGTMTMETYADDLAALLDHLKVEQPVTFCGLSMGGYIGWQFWIRHRHRVQRLILCDTRAAPDSDETARGRAVMAERVLREGPSFLAESMVEKLFSSETRSHRTDVVRETQSVISSTDPVGIAAALRGMACRPDVRSELSEIQVPVLLICGSEDAITPPDEMRTLATALPQAHYVEIPGTGHMSVLEDPPTAAQAVREFLS